MNSHRFKIIGVFILIIVLTIFMTACDMGDDAQEGNERLDNIIEEEKLILMDEKPEKGFHWQYYLYIPERVEKENSIRLLVEPNVSMASDNMDVHRNKAEETAKYNYYARGLEIPVLVPVFPNFESKPDNYDVIPNQFLCERMLKAETDEIKRVDKQLVKMIEHAQSFLHSEYDIETKNRIFITGGSASGQFANSFSKLHPEKVRAVAAGATNQITLPVDSWNGYDFNYPAGINDLRDLTDERFNLDDYKKISKYYFVGEFETIVPLLRDSEQIAAVYDGLGKNIPERWEEKREIYKEQNIPGQLVVYNSTGHRIRPEMMDDVLEFFENNRGQEMKDINPYEYGDEEFYDDFERIEEFNIIDAFWSYDSELPLELKKIVEEERTVIDEFILQTKETICNDIQIAEFIKRNDFSIQLKNGNKTINLDMENVRLDFYNIVELHDECFSGIYIRLTEEKRHKIDFDEDYEVKINEEVSEYYNLIPEQVILYSAEHEDLN